MIAPTPEGISCPLIMFSFIPNRKSILFAIAALISTLALSWKAAAEKKEDFSIIAALLIPFRTISNLTFCLFSSSRI